MRTSAQDFVWDRHRHALAVLDHVDSSAPPISPTGASVPTRDAPIGGRPYPSMMRPSELSAPLVAHGIESDGCVGIERLLGRDQIGALIAGIDHAFDGFDGFQSTGRDDDEWFEPFIPGQGMVHVTRDWLRRGGGMFAADSPPLLQLWLSTLHQAGIVDLVRDLFGETPLTSLDKCSLRRIDPSSPVAGIEWHQDGSFIGIENRPLNLWVALTDCAVSPGLEMLPRRLDGVVETGTRGATYDWSVGADLVADLAATSPVVRPELDAGDAFLFDGLLLHRTAQPTPAMKTTRYAIETWFFRPSSFPRQQEVPLSF